jgi:hypothetical protein
MPMKTRPESSDHPATLVAAHNATILCLLKCAVLPVRRDHLHAVVLQLLIQAIAIVSFVANRFSGFASIMLKSKVS